MKILLTGHKGYIGAVAGPVLSRCRTREVVGLDTDLFAGCEFGDAFRGDPRRTQGRLRSLTKADLESFDGVVHLGRYFERSL